MPRGDKELSAAAEREATAAHRNDYYDVQADRFASPRVDEPSPPLFDAFIRGLPGKGHVVELGCGAGHDLTLLVEAGLNIRGYDLSPALAAMAKERSGAVVEVCDMRDVRLRPGSLDGVLAVDSLLHLDKNELASMLEAIADWLRPGGLFLARMMLGRGLIVDAAGRRFRFVDASGWRSALGAAGFEIVAAASATDQRHGASPCWIATLGRKPDRQRGA